MDGSKYCCGVWPGGALTPGILALRPPMSLDSSSLMRSPTSDPLDCGPCPADGLVCGLVAGLVVGLGLKPLTGSFNLLSTLSTSPLVSGVEGTVGWVIDGALGGVLDGVTAGGRGKPGREVKVTGIG